MARTIISRKGNKPLRIVNRFSDGGNKEDISNPSYLDTNLHVDVPSVGETAMRNRTKPFSEKFNEFQSGNIGTGLQKGINAFNALSSLQAGEMPSVFSLNNFDYSQAGPQGSVYQAIDETAQLLGGISNLTKKKRKPLSDIVGLAAYGGNLYAGGGLVGTALSGVTSAVANGIQQAKIADTSELKKGIINQGNAQINASNYDDLQNAWAQRTTMNHISAKDLRNKSAFDDVLNSFSGSAQGAATGAAIASGIGDLKNQNSAAYGGNIYPMNNRYNKYGFGGDIAGAVIGGVGSLIGSFIGRSKANKEAKRVNQLVDAMNTRNYMSYVNNANNIEAQNDLSMMANYAALGGPIYPYNTINTMGLYNTGDALGWDYLQDRLSLAQQKVENEENNKNDKENNLFASGGGIHINPKNKGKLTATAKRTGKSFSELAHSKNPLTRKRAIFALNARKWHHGKKHALGGDLQSNGADWDLGFTTIGNGGTHEMNPNEGVQMGMDNQGIPNLVEQGEVIYDNGVSKYAFSNRIPVDEEVIEQFNLPSSYSGITYAKAAEKASKEIDERPNDPISKRGLDATMNRLMQAQEYTKQQEQANRIKEMINTMSPDELQGLMAMANQGMQQQAQDQAIQEQVAQEQMLAQQGIDPNALGAEALYGACGGRLARKYSGTDTTTQQLPTPSVSSTNYGQTASEALWMEFLQDNIDKIKNLTWYKDYDANKSAHNWQYWISDFLTANPEYHASTSVMPQALRQEFTSDYKNPKPLVNTSKEGIEGLAPVLQAYDAVAGTNYALPFNGLEKDENGQYAPWFNDKGENINQYAYRIWKESQKGDKPIDVSSLPADIQDYIAAQEDTRKGSKLAALRYASIIPQLIGLGLSARKPNNEYADRLIRASQNTGYMPVKAEPIGNYVQYTPQDTFLPLAENMAAGRAAVRNYLGLSNANRGAAAAFLAANNYNTQLANAELFRKAALANEEQKLKVAEFNKNTNQFNAQQALEAARANQNAALSARNTNLSLLGQALDWQRQDEKQRWSDIAGNLGQIGKYLSDVGQDTLYNNMVAQMRSNPYSFSTIGYERFLGNPIGASKEEVPKQKAAYGGRLRKNRRRRNG